MSQALLSSLHITSQMIFGVFGVVILAWLISRDIITAEAGLPILSATTAYLLGKSYKDVGFDVSKPKSQDKKEDRHEKV